MTKAQRLRLLSIVFGLCALGMSVWLTVLSSHDRSFTFFVFDVGQGDALFAETPSGRQLLIDGGPSGAVLEKLGRAMSFSDRSIDVVVLTHPDADHLTGLVDVLSRYRVGQLVLTGVREATPTEDAFWSLVQRRHIPVTYVLAGSRVQLDSDTTFTVLAPFESWKDREAKTVNNTSIVGRLDYRHFSLLLPGDAETPIEQQLVQNNSSLHADVLKLGHHGSKTSTSDAFLTAVAPSLAVISVGADNRFGHPSSEVLERLKKQHVSFLRTDQGADIRIESNGETFHVHRGVGFRIW